MLRGRGPPATEIAVVYLLRKRRFCLKLRNCFDPLFFGGKSVPNSLPQGLACVSVTSSVRPKIEVCLQGFPTAS